jgi:hypothetical protein
MVGYYSIKKRLTPSGEPFLISLELFVIIPLEDGPLAGSRSGHYGN